MQGTLTHARLGRHSLARLTAFRTAERFDMSYAGSVNRSHFAAGICLEAALIRLLLLAQQISQTTNSPAPGLISPLSSLSEQVLLLEPELEAEPTLELLLEHVACTLSSSDVSVVGLSKLKVLEASEAERFKPEPALGPVERTWFEQESPESESLEQSVLNEPAAPLEMVQVWLSSASLPQELWLLMVAISLGALEEQTNKCVGHEYNS